MSTLILSNSWQALTKNLNHQKQKVLKYIKVLFAILKLKSIIHYQIELGTVGSPTRALPLDL